MLLPRFVFSLTGQPLSFLSGNGLNVALDSRFACGGLLMMNRFVLGACLVALSSTPWVLAAPPPAPGPGPGDKPEPHHFEPFKPESTTSNGTVSHRRQAIAYQAIAGTLVVHPKGWDDVPRDPNSGQEPGAGRWRGKNPTAEASMFYVAYFKERRSVAARPPSPSFTTAARAPHPCGCTWAHSARAASSPPRMSTLRPRPIRWSTTASSLLDASDLVFIDAPGTGFSRIAGKDKEKAFYGVDPDAYAFTEFISQFLSKYGRWNSPKYLFGESYGTTALGGADQRARVGPLDRLQRRDPAVADPQLRSESRSPDRQSRVSTCPIRRCCRPMPPPPGTTTSCPASIKHRSRFWRRSSSSPWATTPGRWRPAPTCSAKERSAVAEKLHQYTGLPVDYILKADLRIDGGEFRQTLQGDEGMTTGPARHPLLRPRHRSSEPARRLRPAGHRPELGVCLRVQRLRPQGPALRRGQGLQAQHSDLRYVEFRTNYPGRPAPQISRQGSNVMPDLANAMKINPNLKFS